MMSGLLSEDAIAALVDAAREGELPGDTAAEAPAQRRGRAPSIRVVDFHRTVKFKSEHQDRLKRAAETFCRVAATRVTSELRTMASLELMQVEQGMWSRVHAELTPSSLWATLAQGADRPPLIMAVEQPLVLEAVDRLLGGDGRSEIVDRPLTEVDRLIARRFFNTLSYCLGQAWKELCGEDLELQRIMSYEQAADVCAIEEPTLVLTLEVKLDRVSTVMAILVPFNAIGALLARMGSAPAPDPSSGTALAANLSDIDIDLRAEVGFTHMTADQVLALRPGDVIALDNDLKGAARLYADTVPLTSARPGRNGRRRAVQIDSTLEDGR
jgi:flagellar motor switch protein FliM